MNVNVMNVNVINVNVMSVNVMNVSVVVLISICLSVSESVIARKLYI